MANLPLKNELLDLSTIPTVFYVDDDEVLCESIRFLLESVNLSVETFLSAQDFLKNYNIERSGCLLLDVRMPEINGLELQEQLRKRNIMLPIIFITGHGDVPMATKAMKAGAFEFLTKPFHDQTLLDSIQQAIAVDAERRKIAQQHINMAKRIAKLTPRECEVMRCVIKGNLNKETAAALDISPKTVELHRAQVMKKMKAKSLAELVSMVLAAEENR
ncbi:MAG: response regulator transcription factor [Gammaproteobacteria bacterium]|nr:response regulator transcription factor [Gammaproteobacteria bacterium]